MLKDINVIDGRDLMATLSTIPRKSGVYAWYPRISVDDATIANFRTSLSNELDSRTKLPTLTGSIGPYGVDLRPRTSTLTPKKDQISLQLSQSSKARSAFAYAILATSVFQPPLYVGKANSLRARLRTHAIGDTDFAEAMTAKGLMPTKLVVAYVVLDKLPTKANELVEFVLTVLSTPPYVKRRG